LWDPVSRSRAHFQSSSPLADFEMPYWAGITGRLATGNFGASTGELVFFLADGLRLAGWLRISKLKR
jgi:hypothetical protein